MSEPLRALVTDDEPPARRRLRRLLEAAEVEVVGEARNGREAVEAIRELAPNLVFLDIQMPDLDGFGVVAEIGPAAMPTTVFVTAYDRYALRAFEVHALDYLLKPFDDARFAASLERVREDIRRKRLDGLCERLRALLEEPKPANEAAPKPTNAPHTEDARTGRITIRSAGRVLFVDVADIDWVEGAGTYARIHAGDRTYLLRQTLRHLETTLDPERFLRIHRSALVNVERVRELQPLSHGESRVILRDGQELKLSRGYREALPKLLGR